MASVGRLWSYAGLVVWFRAMWTMECRKEPFILTCIPFICVTHTCFICAFEGRMNLCWGLLCLFLYLLCLLCQTRGTGSLFCFDNMTDLVTAPLPLSLSALRPFYLFIIKSYYSTAPMCLIHLRLSFNHCHTAPLFCSTN